jgi:hypothetical protein
MQWHPFSDNREYCVTLAMRLIARRFRRAQARFDGAHASVENNNVGGVISGLGGAAVKSSSSIGLKPNPKGPELLVMKTAPYPRRQRSRSGKRELNSRASSAERFWKRRQRLSTIK